MTRSKDWIYIQDPSGKRLVASPSYIAKLLGINALTTQLHSIFNRLNMIENRLNDLEKPVRKNRVLDLLREEDGKRHNALWFVNRIHNLAYWEIEELLTEGKLSASMRGSQPMYGLAENSK